MSRVASQPIALPDAVDFNMAGANISVKSSKGELTHTLHDLVKVDQDAGQLRVTPVDDSQEAKNQAGTARALLNNMCIGLVDGFKKVLLLVGVGYRVKLSGNKLELALGFSHPVKYQLPEGIAVTIVSQTEFSVEGVDKQKVGQVAAEIRGKRPPEPYKGKGVRYADENIRRKETKKK